MAEIDMMADRGNTRFAVVVSIGLAVGVFAVAWAVGVREPAPARGPIAVRNLNAAAPVESLAGEDSGRVVVTSLLPDDEDDPPTPTE